MAAKMRIENRIIENVGGDLEDIRVRRDDDEGDTVMIIQGDDHVWLAPDDVAALVAALHAAVEDGI